MKENLLYPLQTKDFALIEGQGSDITKKKTLLTRAKRKLITQKTILNLIDVCKDKEDTERIQAYWNTFHCQNKLISFQGRLYGNYCKNRFCTLCSAIRKADLINTYYPVLKTWEEPHFVTLTVKSVKARSLSKWIKGVLRAFQLILDRCKKRYQRGKGILLVGIKSLECNFNPQAKTYNPHLHIITKNKEIAELLKQEWLLQWRYKDNLTKRVVSYQAQFIRKVENLERDLIETIKYGSKIFTEPDVKKKKTSSIPPMVYAKALDTIFVAMKGKRIFERFGFNLPKTEKPQQYKRFIKKFERWEYDTFSNDWVNTQTGEGLTEFSPTTELHYLLQEGINTELG